MGKSKIILLSLLLLGCSQETSSKEFKNYVLCMHKGLMNETCKNIFLDN